MTRAKTRRAFIRQSALAAAGLMGKRTPLSAKATTATTSQSANEKLGIAVIGVHGRGRANLAAVGAQAIVALCDVDEFRAYRARKAFPKARFYTDFRRVFDRKDIDAVVVSTPDHTHAPATMMALRAGKHVYCEKPLTHSVYEARQVTEMAAKMKRVTQMGIQIHATDNYRCAVELIQTGAIGPVAEVHVWSGDAYAPGDRPKDTPPVPKGLHYDEWLGPAPYRPYHPAHVPYKWRGWWDFGGGGLGDMGCHLMDLAHWALGLRHVVAVEADGPPVHPESTPPWQIVRYEYPARKDKPPVKLTWYNGDRRPTAITQRRFPGWDIGVLFVGSKGQLLVDYKRRILLPAKTFADFEPPAPFIPRSIGHHSEWIQACKTSGKTSCSFNYSGPLAEAVLLGNVAYRSGRRIEWDAENLKITNAPEAMRFVRRPYRKGWTL